MQLPKRVLIIDDDPDLSTLLKQYISKKGFEVEQAATGAQGIAKARETRFEAILLDIGLPDINGLEVLKTVKAANPDSAVIMITAYSDVRTAVSAIKSGAYDYVTKPIYQEEILSLINKALTKEEPGTQVMREYVGGRSQASESVSKSIEIVGPTDLSVVLEGETGVGKEYVARAIHSKSKRSKGPFMAVDCGAFPPTLAESILFGHVKGAFTDANTDKKGLFEMASTGTLFLDEVANLSYELQPKLLRVIQERTIIPVGGTNEMKVDVRLIAASNNDLAESVGQGTFREDLYHRLNEFRIGITPLRERREDIMLYAEHFLAQANQELNKNVSGISEDATAILLKYHWYGNLRELKNVIRRATLLSTTKKITREELPTELTAIVPARSKAIADGDLRRASNDAERSAIIAALEKCNYNKTRAAELLNIDRKTLYNKLAELNISTSSTKTDVSHERKR